LTFDGDLYEVCEFIATANKIEVSDQFRAGPILGGPPFLLS
jgi:hypothetical protein